MAQVPATGAVPFEELAKKVGLDVMRFRSDFRSEAIRGRVEADRKEAKEIGVNGTPSFFIGGRRVVERPSVESFSLLVDKAIGEREGRFSWDLKPAP